jgi:HK97 family phage portal protein
MNLIKRKRVPQSEGAQPLLAYDLEAREYVRLRSAPTVAENTATKAATALLGVGQFEKFNVPEYTLPENQQKAYQASPWVANAVGIPSRYAAAQPFQVFGLEGEDKTQIPNHPFELLLQNPNPLDSQFQLFEKTFAFALLTGNVYWWFFGGAGTPKEIYVLPPNRISPVPGADIGTVSHYEWDDGSGRPVLVPPDEVVHFKEFHPRNMWVGLARTESAAVSIEKDDKAAHYDLAFYGKENAKPEAIIALQGNFDPGDIPALRERLARRHGGTKREMAIIENAETLNYIQLALNYADMDFIANRQFTKEQIYDQYCPGLASVLAVNSTEANARTGKATMMEFGIWPMLVSVHQTISKKILPLYGDNLLAEFEDVRLSDLAMELADIQEYGRYHTIDEIRQTKYNAEPLGDDRGNLLPQQISPLTTFGGDEPAAPVMPVAAPNPQAQGQAPGGMETGGNEAQEPVKAQPKPAPPPPDDLMKAEIRQYARHVRKSLKADKAYKSLWKFNTEHIPASLKAAIAGALDVADSDDVAMILESVVAYG